MGRKSIRLSRCSCGFIAGRSSLVVLDARCRESAYERLRALRAARVFKTMAATMHRAPVIRLGVMVSPSRSTPRTMEVRGWRG